jgi:hypothetical protein
MTKRIMHTHLWKYEIGRLLNTSSTKILSSDKSFGPLFLIYGKPTSFLWDLDQGFLKALEAFLGPLRATSIVYSGSGVLGHCLVKRSLAAYKSLIHPH